MASISTSPGSSWNSLQLPVPNPHPPPHFWGLGGKYSHMPPPPPGLVRKRRPEPLRVASDVMGVFVSKMGRGFLEAQRQDPLHTAGSPPTPHKGSP